MISYNSFVKLTLATIFLLIGFVLTININTQNSSAQFTQNINLTGTWKANDGGTYYIRNIDNDVWWLGISSNDDGKTFSNVLKGQIHINNKTITADWSDIPRGTNGYYGKLTLVIDSNTMLHKVNETNYNKSGDPSCCFGSSKWQR
jgi:hypothetical protein